MGTEIKVHRRSQAELLEASGYQQQPSEFHSLLRILDGELRLITPTDPETAGSQSRSDSGSQFYQLPHDYLVPSLRQWLNRKQRETRKGRAELRLAEQASLWSTRPENRYLPSPLEFLSVASLTDRKMWTAPQQMMMKKAATVYGLRAAAVLATVLCLLLLVTTIKNRIDENQHQTRAESLVKQLLNVATSKLPGILADIQNDIRFVEPQLRTLADDAERSPSERMRAMLPLVGTVPEFRIPLVREALSADRELLRLVREQCVPFGQEISNELWKVVLDKRTGSSGRMRAALMLAVVDAESDNWIESGNQVTQSLLELEDDEFGEWLAMVQPVAAILVPHFSDQLRDPQSTASVRAKASDMLARYAEAGLLGDLLLDADGPEFSRLSAGAKRHGPALQEHLSATVREMVRTGSSSPAGSAAAKWRNAAMLMIVLNQHTEPDGILSAAADPTVRTHVLLDVSEFGITIEQLASLFSNCRSPVSKQAVLISFGVYENLSARELQMIDSIVTDVLSNSAYWAERSAAEWLLKHDGRNLKPEVRSVHRQVPSGGSIRPGIDPDFWTNSQGQTMVVIRGPVSFECGSPANERGREENEDPEHHTITYSFAVSAREVTVDQLRRCRTDAEVSWPDLPPDTAAHKVSFTEALQYCRWLSEEELIQEDQMCYPAVAEITDQLVLPQERLLRNGYRLLTEPEWECACRAGSVTPWFFGSNESHASEFAWSILNSVDQVRSVGLLRPNELGLFDMSGNVGEWCHLSREGGEHSLRGGTYRGAVVQLRSARRYYQSEKPYSFTGFRIARTLITSSADHKNP